MPKSVRDRIIAVLDTLSKKQLIVFKHKLSELKIIGYGLIEKEITVQITQRLVSKFTEARAIARTAEVLRAIGLQDEADSLEQGENDRK
uniref:Pyrin domain-containing protein n=1 Tax=Anguilla anguilla TaxID=7936 RepID=A0A0E9XI13_ANGAN